MSAIHQALGGLLQSIEGLESALRQQQQKPVRTPNAVPQPDLFNARATPAAAPAVDPALLSRTLDNMIGKLELLLKE